MAAIATEMCVDCRLNWRRLVPWLYHRHGDSHRPESIKLFFLAAKRVESVRQISTRNRTGSGPRFHFPGSRLGVALVARQNGPEVPPPPEQAPKPSYEKEPWAQEACK